MQFDTSTAFRTRAFRSVAFSQTAQLNGWLGGMDKSEVPFVYHHLRKGCILQLIPFHGEHSQHLMFCVNYGSYRLGILNSTMSRKVQELQSANSVFRITISAIVKEKYLPPTAIELELEWG